MREEQPAGPPSGAGGTDVDEALAVFARDYNGKHFSAARGAARFSWHHTSVEMPAISLRTCRFGTRVAGEVQPENDYIVSWFTKGTGVLDRGRSDMTVVDRRPVVFPSGRPFTFRYEAFDQRLIHFDRVYLEGVAAESTGEAPVSLRFDSTTRLNPQGAAQWRDVVALVAGTLRPESRATPLMQQQAAHLAATVLLSVFPRSAEPSVEPSVPERAARLRPALEYIHANAATSITVSDVARAADLSTRALQVAFRQHLECTVTQYIRDVRLDRAREDLASAAAGMGTTVADVARRWGFLHLGHFAAHYAERFHEQPRVTLSR